MRNFKVGLGCLSVVLICLFSSAWAQGNDDLPRGQPGKYAGQIISPLTDRQIASWCDFHQQIVVTQTGVLCVYKG